jgi:hypothetical protein
MFNFLPEIVLMAICGYGILISFRCRLLKENDKIPKIITGEKLTKYIFIIYLFLATFTNYNLSYLSLIYMLSIQFLMLMNSIKFNEEKDYDIIEEKIIDAHSGCCILCVILISLLIILGSVPGIWLYFALVSNHQLWLCMFQ